MAETHATTDHGEIKRWVEERGGNPSRVKGTARAGEAESGLLRIDFGEPEESLEKISWDDFFEVFDDRHLAFLYQDDKGKGGKNYFCKLVSRESLSS
jgi:hypothetical protein